MKRSRINPVSDRRRGEGPQRAAVKAAARERDGGRCVLAGVMFPCQHLDADDFDGHEIVNRSQYLRPHLVLDLVVTMCRRHHNWVTTHPDDAEPLGVHFPGWAWKRNPAVGYQWSRAAQEAARRRGDGTGLRPYWRMP